VRKNKIELIFSKICIKLAISEKYETDRGPLCFQVSYRLHPIVAETGIGKPPFKASDGGQIDMLRELEEITTGELQQGSGT